MVQVGAWKESHQVRWWFRLWKSQGRLCHEWILHEHACCLLQPWQEDQYYTVQWPTDSLSWEDFRRSVLRATDPSAAPECSVRREILDNYMVLGLETKPNTGDNGVHSSASPFEAMSEQANWLGTSIESDPFGKGLLAAGIPKATIVEWAQDSQVSVEGVTAHGKTMIVFDALEDLSAEDVLAKVGKMSN
jgi:hypothetical protein